MSAIGKATREAPVAVTGQEGIREAPFSHEADRQTVADGYVWLCMILVCFDLRYLPISQSITEDIWITGNWF